MIVEPLLEDLDGLLGQVSPPLPGGGGGLRRRVLLRRGVVVRGRAWVALAFANCGKKENITIMIDLKTETSVSLGQLIAWRGLWSAAAASPSGECDAQVRSCSSASVRVREAGVVI